MSIEITSDVSPTLCREIENLEQIVFPNTYRPGRFTLEAPDKKGLLALLIRENNDLVAYKVGYRLKPDTFYSWVGGVHPEYRYKGFAKKLMKTQHQLLKENGYAFVRTKTRMTFRGMLILNLKYGFDITGLNYKASLPGLVIQMEKAL